mmetsp:Transcript_2938/g.9807  ORF Transcript_2938/g.9807 Transcript_2938/m.9807 type:complete len:110 (+) Transcript_2938:636-965(+)
MGRDAMKARYRLPNDELCCQCSPSSFLPYYLIVSCEWCAIYQEAYFLKHDQKMPDFKCCIYQACCACVPAAPREQTSLAASSDATPGVAPQPTSLPAAQLVQPTTAAPY